MDTRKALDPRRKTLQGKLNKTVTTEDHWDQLLGQSHKKNVLEAEALYKDSKDKADLAIWEKAIIKAEQYIKLKANHIYTHKNDNNKTDERRDFIKDQKAAYRAAKGKSSILSWCCIFCCSGSSDEPEEKAQFIVEASDEYTVEINEKKEHRHDALNRLKEKYKDTHTDTHTHSNGYRRLMG